MTSSQTTEHQVFKQEEYNHTFYCCFDNHPFIAFTTCYCPLCDSIGEEITAIEELEQAETSLDNLREDHADLIMKVSKYAPELLI